jgi:uncharacterized Rmd1/YagE family protein
MAIKRNDLFKLVAQNNAVLIAVLSKLSLLERSDTAWKMPAYVHVWEGLREEFEIDDRFDNLKYKLNLIQDNTKFFLEIMHNQKSNMLEWIIIVLISAECVLMIMDICDMNPSTLMETVSAVLPIDTTTTTTTGVGAAAAAESEIVTQLEKIAETKLEK